MQHSYPFPRRLFTRGALLAALLGGGCCLGAQAQSLNYTVTGATNVAGTYTDLGSTGTAIATTSTDDANSAPQPIGFTFSYNGQSFTQFVLNTNGAIALGATAPSVANLFGNFENGQALGVDPIASPSTADNNLLLPFNFDLETGSLPAEYRVSTTGTAPNQVCTIQWKNVHDKAGGTASQYANFSFQLKLYQTSNTIEFVYGAATPSTTGSEGARFPTVGIKGSGSAAGQDVLAYKTSSLNPWSSTTFITGEYLDATHNFRRTVGPDPGRTYRFTAAIANDAAVTALYNIEQIPTGQAYTYSTVVQNVGSTTIGGATLTLTLGGANPSTQTQTLPSLVAGGQLTVTFPSITFTRPGTNTVSVALSADANTANNTQTATTVSGTSTTTTAATFSYITPTVAPTSSYGFRTGTAQFTSAFCAAYTPTTQFRVNVVRALLGTDPNAVGQTVYGVVLDASGTLLAQSPAHVIATADLGTLYTFTLATPVTVPAGQFLVGLAQVVGTTAYFPMAVQTETPTRNNTFFVAGISTPSAPTDVAPANLNIRYLVEAGGFGTALATASPALARAISVFPNPSATGLLHLESNGLQAPAGLAVEVLSQLGQVVYRTTTPANTSATLDLSYLGAGLYHVQVRNGDEFMSRQIAIVK